MTTLRLTLVGLAFIAAAIPLDAGPSTAQLFNCSISTTGVAFGNYDPQSATPDDAVGTVTIRCLVFDPAPNVALGTGTRSPKRACAGRPSVVRS